MMVYRDFGEFEPWGGATDTWERVCDENRIDELESILEDMYPEGMSETALNDLLWFDADFVFDTLGIDSEEEEEED